MKFIKKIILFINEYLNFDRKYLLTIMGTSLSFYNIISISSIVVVMISFITYTNELFASFLINDIINIIGTTFKGLISEVFDKITLSGFSIVLVFSIIFSASSYISKLTMFTDKVYINYNKRGYLKSRFNGALIFLMLILILFGEIGAIIYSKYLLFNVFKINSFFINKLITFIFELLMIFIFVLIIYIYLPPIRIRVKEIYKITGIITFLIYIALFLFKIVFQIISFINYVNAIIYAFVITSFLLFSINYLMMLGIIIFYHMKSNNKCIVNYN